MKSSIDGVIQNRSRLGIVKFSSRL